MTDIPTRRLEPAFRSGHNVLHLTKTLLGSRALCGYYVDMIGIPKDAVACKHCNRVGEEQGYTEEDLERGVIVRAMGLGGAQHAEHEEPPKYTQFRADGWPYCPHCGEDELYSLANPPTVDTICGCYRCGPWPIIVAAFEPPGLDPEVPQQHWWGYP